MTEWISVKDRLPPQNALCIVSNSAGYMYYIRAVHYGDGRFSYDNPDVRETLMLDVTHYIEMPPTPRE